MNGKSYEAHVNAAQSTTLSCDTDSTRRRRGVSCCCHLLVWNMSKMSALLVTVTLLCVQVLHGLPHTAFQVTFHLSLFVFVPLKPSANSRLTSRALLLYYSRDTVTL